MSWANYLFSGLEKKSSLVSQLAVSTDAEIAGRISQSVTSDVTESNEDTFKSDIVFDSFHHQTRIPILDRALLAGFLMLWLMQYVVPTPPHEVIIADIICSVFLLAYGRPLGLLPAMVGCLQSELQILCQSFSNIVVEEDRESNVVVGLDGKLRMKTSNPHVELPYTYLMVWYVMHCLSLMSVVQLSEDSMPFVQRLECSTWNGWYMLMIDKSFNAAWTIN